MKVPQHFLRYGVPIFFITQQVPIHAALAASFAFPLLIEGAKPNPPLSTSSSSSSTSLVHFPYLSFLTTSRHRQFLHYYYVSAMCVVPSCLCAYNFPHSPTIQLVGYFPLVFILYRVSIACFHRWVTQRVAARIYYTVDLLFN